ncbi:hypothetical protein C8258_31940 [Nocardia sp. MDA0666]|uniref:DUF4226 domain-containing protein n=1 Tax=Nocardia sp. MDA0666 TaxID=2135448 RepID=UPI000D125E09|nr:DUF4226 domain-containing protein [Nocardia sp. MDA0666]PSR58068.1 hypothetical protein C8258_31940 [Nocardia sp. MDA0666]
MTSAETWQATVADDMPEPAESDSGTGEGQSARPTPWSKPARQSPGRSGLPISGSPAASDTATPVSDSIRPEQTSGPRTVAAASSVPASSASTSPWAAGRAAPAESSTTPATVTNSAVPASAPAAGSGLVTPRSTAPAAGDGEADDGGMADPSALTSAMLPAMSMLPMLASALAGLGKNGSGTQQSGSGNGGGTGSNGSGGLTPEAQQALDALRKLKDTYGDEDKAPTSPDSGGSGKQLDTRAGSGSVGSGKTAAQIKAHQLFQRNAASAFNTLDNDLVDYMRRHAGKHTTDKKAVAQLLRDVDTALAQLGSAAYTKTGQLQVHRILTKALEQATRIVGGGSANSKEAASEINRLTKQYMYNLGGQRFSRSGGSGTKVGGTVGQWIQQALGVLAAAGVDTSRIDPQAIAIIIRYESGGNPSATNNWDSNAANGTPSIGLMQTIGPTFNSYALPGHRNIYNPIDNIVAGVRYAISRYGSVSNVPGVVAVRNGQAYRGY